MDDSAAGIGHNAPPDPLLTEASERVEVANRWLSERGDWQTWDADVADRCNFFIGQIAATFKALDDRRKDENRDWLAKQDKVYKDPLALLTMAKDKLTPLRRLWLQREEEKVQEARRKAEAEAETARKAAAEAAAKAATAKNKLEAELAAAKAQEAAAQAEQAIEAVPERAQIKGSFTTTATSLRDYWSAEIVDLSAAFKHYNKKGHPAKATIEGAIRDAIFDIANAEAKRAKTEDAANFPPGIRFKKERK